MKRFFKELLVLLSIYIIYNLVLFFIPDYRPEITGAFMALFFSVGKFFFQGKGGGMTDKMSDVIYVYDFVGDTATAIRENNSYAHCCIRQDSINVPDELDEAIMRIEEFENFPHKDRMAFETVLNASRELQRIKGLK